MSARLSPDFERTLRRYVLGDLDEPLRAELEEMLLSDQEAFEALGVVEDELVEAYLDGQLAGGETLAFERSFLASPARETRLRFARELRRRATHGAARRVVPSGRFAAWQPAWIGLAAALAVSLAGNVWLATRPAAPAGALLSSAEAPQAPSPVATARGPEPDDPGAALAREGAARASADARAARLESELARARAGIATFALAAGRLRSAGEFARLTLPEGAVAVCLQLELTAVDYPRYRASLLDQEGNELWAAARLAAAQGKGETAVVLVLPAGLLEAGDYEVTLSGTPPGSEPELVGVYAFRVAER